MSPNALTSTRTSSTKTFADSAWRQHIFAILFGNIACAFDFIIFVHLDRIIGATFFPPGSSALVGQLQSLVLFSIGYLSRPIGALLIGRYGDIHGRSPALTISLTLFTITTLLMALLPTYAQIGILAPLLFIIFRLIQGMAFGAQMPLGWVFAAEHAPKPKFAIYSNLVTSSLVVGNIFAFGVAALLMGLFTQDVLIAHGWRIPFVIGGALSIIALLLKRKVSETPIFVKHEKQRNYKPKFLDIKLAFKRHQTIGLASVLSFMQLSLVILMVLTPKLLALKFNLSNTMLTVSYLITLISVIFGLIFYGWLADRYSVGKVMAYGALALIVHALIFYIFLPNDSVYYILPMCALLGFLSGVRGLSLVVLVQLFPTEVRLTSVSVIYNCVSAVVGTTLPIALFYSTNLVSSAPGLFIVFIGIIMLMTALVIEDSSEISKLDKLQEAPLPSLT